MLEAEDAQLCGLTETRCLWPGISLGISVTQPAPPPCAPSDRPCTPTAHDAVVRAHRRDVDVDVNPGPCDHRRRSSPRPSFRSFRRTRPATRPRRRKRTSQGRVRYPPPPPNDRGNGSGPPRTGGFGSLIYGEGTAIVVAIFYRRRQRRGRWQCIFLD